MLVGEVGLLMKALLEAMSKLSIEGLKEDTEAV